MAYRSRRCHAANRCAPRRRRPAGCRPALAACPPFQRYLPCAVSCGTKGAALERPLETPSRNPSGHHDGQARRHGRRTRPECGVGGLTRQAIAGQGVLRTRARWSPSVQAAMLALRRYAAEVVATPSARRSPRASLVSNPVDKAASWRGLHPGSAWPAPTNAGTTTSEPPSSARCRQASRRWSGLACGRSQSASALQPPKVGLPRPMHSKGFLTGAKLPSESSIISLKPQSAHEASDPNMSI